MEGLIVRGLFHFRRRCLAHTSPQVAKFPTHRRLYWENGKSNGNCGDYTGIIGYVYIYIYMLKFEWNLQTLPAPSFKTLALRAAGLTEPRDLCGRQLCSRSVGNLVLPIK